MRQKKRQVGFLEWVFPAAEMLDNRNTYFDIFALLSRNSYRQTLYFKWRRHECKATSIVCDHDVLHVCAGARADGIDRGHGERQEWRGGAACDGDHHQH